MRSEKRSNQCDGQSRSSPCNPARLRTLGAEHMVNRRHSIRRHGFTSKKVCLEGEREREIERLAGDVREKLSYFKGINKGKAAPSMFP